MNDLVLQFFSNSPRSATGVYLLLTGKKTLSTLYAALLHKQLQWLHVYPTLRRDDFQAAVVDLTRRGLLKETKDGLVCLSPEEKAKAALRWPLPKAYSVRLNLPTATDRLRLGIQAVSEARFKNAHYRPVTTDYVTQQWVRAWYNALGGEKERFIEELSAAFKLLPAKSADEIFETIVAHDYVGAASVDELTALKRVNPWSELLAAIASHQEWATLNKLSGGLVDPLPERNMQAITLVSSGVSRTELPKHLGVKPSTANEYLLLATIFGWDAPVDRLIRPQIASALSRVESPAIADHRELLKLIADAEFFEVRLFQILQMQGRWHNA